MTEPNEDIDAQERLARLAQPGKPVAHFNPRYSLFVRRMRLILPLIALVGTAVVFSWSSMRDDNILPLQSEENAPQTIGKNELLNPKFESTDKKNQPFTITAERALQGKEDENLVLLEKPVADILLNSGNWVAIKAAQGSYRQDNERLNLRGKVNLFHDRGYRLETEELHIDLQNNTARSELDVYGQGPAGTLQAKGLEGSSNEGHLIFNGPAKLVLNRNVPNVGEEQ